MIVIVIIMIIIIIMIMIIAMQGPSADRLRHVWAMYVSRIPIWGAVNIGRRNNDQDKAFERIVRSSNATLCRFIM